MRNRPFVALAALLLASALACASGRPAVDAAPPLAGHYSALSDWTLELELRDDGRAVIQYVWWKAGSDGGRQLQAMFGTWERDDETGEIVLRYGQVTDRLRYERRLSLADAGRKGSRPGLRGVPPVDRRSLIGAASLWSQGAD